MITRIKKLFLCLLFSPLGLVFAQSNSWAGYGTTPSEVLTTVVGEANKNVQFQETALDQINNTEGGYQKEFQIANTLDYVRMHLSTYLQWFMYVGLSMAVILLIYNGFLLVTHTITKSGDLTKVKKNIMYIAI